MHRPEIVRFLAGISPYVLIALLILCSRGQIDTREVEHHVVQDVLVFPVSHPDDPPGDTFFRVSTDNIAGTATAVATRSDYAITRGAASVEDFDRIVKGWNT